MRTSRIAEIQEGGNYCCTRCKWKEGSKVCPNCDRDDGNVPCCPMCGSSRLDFIPWKIISEQNLVSETDKLGMYVTSGLSIKNSDIPLF